MSRKPLTEEQEKKYLQVQATQRSATCLRVLNAQLENPRLTQEEACEMVGIKPRTFRNWVARGALDDWLREYAETLTRSGQSIVLDSWERVLKHMIAVATGAVTDKSGAVAAAEFLRKAAGIKFVAQDAPQKIEQMNVYMLPQTTVKVEDGKPVIEGEYEDVTEKKPGEV